MVVYGYSRAFRFTKFIGSGGVAGAVHSTVMFGLLHFGVGAHKAFLVGFTSGVVVRFFFDRNLVFKATGQDAGAQFLRYAVACVVAYCTSATLFWVFLDVLHWNQLLAFILAVTWTTVIAYGLVAVALRGSRKTAV